ncbi:MAG: ribosome silencing factor [Gammaproteobacteria bacterium]|nr:ribosome silencing factor [Gammaproteobacteria bacterium]
MQSTAHRARSAPRWIRARCPGIVCILQLQITLINIIYTGNQVTDTKPVELQSEATKKLALEALDALKAENLVVLDVRELASFTDTMIFASGSSTRHVKAIAESVIEAAKTKGSPPIGVEGEDIGEWILVDLGDVVVHVMQPDVRLYYELEKLWGEELTAG